MIVINESIGDSSFEKIAKEEEFDDSIEDCVVTKEASTEVKYGVFGAAKTGNNRKDIINSWNSSIENYFFSINDKGKKVLSTEKRNELNTILEGLKKIEKI